MSGASWRGSFAVPALLRIGFVMHVAAAQERNAIQHIFLDPFQGQIDYGRDVKSDELRNNESADNDKTQRPA